MKVYKRAGLISWSLVHPGRVSSGFRSICRRLRTTPNISKQPRTSIIYSTRTAHGRHFFGTSQAGKSGLLSHFRGRQTHCSRAAPLAVWQIMET